MSLATFRQPSDYYPSPKLPRTGPQSTKVRFGDFVCLDFKAAKGIVFQILPGSSSPELYQSALFGWSPKEIASEQQKIHRDLEVLLASTAGLPLFYAQVMQLKNLETGEYLSYNGEKVVFDKEPSQRTLFKFKPIKQTSLTQSQVMVTDETVPMVFADDTVDILHFQTQFSLEGVKVAHSDGPAFPNKSTLESGIVIRIYHGGAGYLHGSKFSQGVYFKSHRLETGENVSPNSCWVMESVGTKKTKKTWRLKLLGTDLYLRHLDETEPGLPPRATRLALGPKTDDVSTAFAIHVKDPNRPFFYGAIVHIKSVGGFHWQVLDGTASSNEENFESRVFCVEKPPKGSPPVEHADFSIHMTAPYILKDAEQFALATTTIEKFAEKASDSGRRAAAVKSMQTILLRLEPKATHTQKSLLGGPNFIKALAAIVLNATEKEELNLALRLLHIISHHHGKNGSRFLQHLPLASLVKAVTEKKELFAGSRLPGALFEAFHNNHLLLCQTTRQDVLDLFKLQTVTGEVEFYRTIGTLAHDGPGQTYHLQNFITDHLISIKSQLPKFRLQANTPEIVFPGESGQKLADVLKDSAQHSNLTGLLELFGDVCGGRSEYSVKGLTTGLPPIAPDFGFCFAVLKDKSFSYFFRCAVAKVMWSGYMEIAENHPRTTAFKRNWINRSPFEAYSFTGEAGNPVVKYPNPTSLPELLIDFFFDANTYKFAAADLAPGQAQFTHQMIKIVKGAFLFGLFKRKELWFPPQLAKILAWPRSSIADEAHRVVTAIKHETLDILQRYLDLQDNTLLVNEFEKQVKTDQWNKQVLQSKWELVANEGTITIKGIEDLCKALLTACRGFNEGSLASRTLRLLKRLVRSSSRYTALLEALRRSTLLDDFDNDLPLTFSSILKNITSTEGAKVARSRDQAAQALLNAFEGHRNACKIFASEEGIPELISLFNIVAIETVLTKATRKMAALFTKLSNTVPEDVAPFVERLATVSAVTIDHSVKTPIVKIIHSIFEKRPNLAPYHLTRTVFTLLILGLKSAEGEAQTSMATEIAELTKFSTPRIKSTIIATLKTHGIQRSFIDQIKAVVPTCPPCAETERHKKTEKDRAISTAVYDLISQLIMKQVVDKNEPESIWCVVAPLTWSHNMRSLVGVWKLLQACSLRADELGADDVYRQALVALDAGHYVAFWAQSFDIRVAVASFESLQSLIDTSKASAERMTMKLLASDTHFWDKAFELLDRSYRALLHRANTAAPSYACKAVCTFMAVFAKSRKKIGEGGHYFLPAMSGKFARLLVSLSLIDGIDPSVAATAFFAIDSLIHLQPLILQKAISGGLYTAVNRFLGASLFRRQSNAGLRGSGSDTGRRNSIDNGRRGSIDGGRTTVDGVGRRPSIDGGESARRSLERRPSIDGGRHTSLERRPSFEGGLGSSPRKTSNEFGTRPSIDLIRSSQEFLSDSDTTRSMIRLKLTILESISSFPSVHFAQEAPLNEAILFSNLKRPLELLDHTPAGMMLTAIELAAGVFNVLRKLPPALLKENEELVRMVENKVLSQAFAAAEFDQELVSYAMEANEKKSEVMGKKVSFKQRGFDDKTKLWQYWRFAKLETVDLSKNLFTRTASIVTFVNATSLNLSKNKLIEITYLAEIPGLKTLNLSNNLITHLPASLMSWRALESLDLSDNELHAVDPLTSLRTLVRLDLSNNKNLNYLPAALHELSRLKELGLAHTPLLTPPKQIVKRGLESIMGYLRSMKDKVQWDLAKIAVLGAEHCGKTTLVSKLLEAATPASGAATLASATTGKKRSVTGSRDSLPGLSTKAKKPAERADIHGLIVNAMSLKVGSRDVSFLLYDLAGKEEYFAVHNYFLAGRPLFVLCFDASNPNVSITEYWFRTIKWIGGTSPQLLVVGTHADAAKDEKELEAKCKPHLDKWSQIVHPTAVLWVSSKNKKSIGLVKDKIAQLSAEIPVLKTDVPRIYEVACHTVASQRNQTSHTNWAGFKALLVDLINDNEQQLRTLASFLNDLGVIVWTDVEPMNDLVVLDPHWLGDLMGTLVNGTVPTAVNGVVSRADLLKAWPSLSPAMQPAVLGLLETYELLIPHGDARPADSFLIPLTFSKEEPAEFTSAVSKFKKTKLKEVRKLIREFSFKFLPQGFLPRVVCRIAQAYPVNIEAAWKSGILLREKEVAGATKEQLLIEYAPEKFRLTITALQPNPGKPILEGKDLFCSVLSAFNSLLKSFYASTTDKLKQTALCSHCLSKGTDEIGKFAMSDVELAIADGHTTLPCPRDKSPVSLSQLAPDVFSAHLPVINNLALGEALGKGSLGMVWRGKIYNPMRDVVVKQIVANPAAEERVCAGTIRPFYHELSVLSQLHHSNLVKLYGITLNPLRTIVEYAPGSTLRQVIASKPDILTWPLRYKAMLQVARAMAYLHSLSPPILHRDLRSANVFVVDLSAADIKTKVGDFGVAQHCQVDTIEALGTWRWLAPEVLDESSNLDQKTDVYSFAMVLYELTSLNLPFSEFSDYITKSELAITSELLDDDPGLESHREQGWEVSRDGKTATCEIVKVTELKQAIKTGLRPSIAKDISPVLKGLMQSCWEADPKQRPDFVKVVENLEKFMLEEKIIDKSHLNTKLFMHKLKFSELGSKARILTTKEIAHFRQQAFLEFEKHDKDKSGGLDYEEIKTLLNGLCKLNGLPRPTKQDTIDAMAVLDTNGDGVISFDEFFTWWISRLST